MEFIQSKSFDFMLKEFKGENYILKSRIKVVKENEIGYLNIDDGNYDIIATPAVYNCSIIIMVYMEILFF